MFKIFNLGNVPNEHIEDPLGVLSTLYLGEAAGSEKIYVNIDRVQPGAKSVKYHSHSRQEEFFLILCGSGIIRLDGREYPVKKGDFVAKPAGRGIAHQFINTGEDVLEILDVGTKEEGDVAYYPDEDVYLLRDQKKAFSGTEQRVGWSSDPNLT
ncbi:cupin domain-containing protein [Brevibacillus fluminis]|uniref:Cupin domain-containing protein n=1 Tax=Brevibacillus fluminis TaxID=511487 RepID=A0A3M8DPJ5_9BACL|nr:cupin domain-containing protein [Brevibacillus fluminis]RNB89429.1 cupin domain-containing protein [Brevibacillus fluminis]